MADRSAIEWTDATWNPIRGCTPVSEGCRNCYAARVAARFSGPGQPYEGLAKMVDGKPRWTGEVRLIDDHLTDPLRWKKPRRVFVNSMSDLFHDGLTDEDVAAVFAVMAISHAVGKGHTFQVLTKRPERMRDLLMNPTFQELVSKEAEALGYGQWKIRLGRNLVDKPMFKWPLPNVWLGTSVEDQAAASERVPPLLETPAAVRFLSCEPLLGRVDVSAYIAASGRVVALAHGLRTDHVVGGGGGRGKCYTCNTDFPDQGIDWVIAGGESGPGARPMHPAWARFLRDQCHDHDRSFFFKQWGDWVPTGQGVLADSKTPADAPWQDGPPVFRVGKKRAGRSLDGHTHDEMPYTRCTPRTVSGKQSKEEPEVLS